MKDNRQKNSSQVKKDSHVVQSINDITIIKEHIISLDNESIKIALIAHGMYDSNMKLTASYR